MAVTQEQLIPEAFPDRRHEPDSELIEAFRLDLGECQLQYPQERYGHVTAVEKVLPMSMAGEPLPDGVEVFEVSVRNPYVEVNAEGYERVTDYIERMETVLKARGHNPLIERNEANTPEEYTDFTRAWMHDATVKAVVNWRDRVPTAIALDYLVKPVIGRTITDSEHKNEAIVTPESAAQMMLTADAIAINDRTTAMQFLAEQHLKAVPTEEVSWLSLASGTAEPAIAAASKVSGELGKDVNLVVADFDSEALGFVRGIAGEYEFSGNVQTVFTNILSPKLEQVLSRKTGNPDQRYDVVENMGFEEYLPQDGDELEAYRGKNLPQASEFTRSAWERVKPSGVLISGNMVLDRPQLGYVFGIVDWPVINARSEESILNVYKQAGILDDPSAKVEIFRVKNDQVGVHVYDIVRVTKSPLAA